MYMILHGVLKGHNSTRQMLCTLFEEQSSFCQGVAPHYPPYVGHLLVCTPSATDRQNKGTTGTYEKEDGHEFQFVCGFYFFNIFSYF